MDVKFMTGVALGMVGGALIAVNSVKARQMIKDGQETVKEKAEQVMGGSKSKKK